MVELTPVPKSRSIRRDMMFFMLAPALLAAPLVPEADDIERDVAALQGTWKMVRLQVGRKDQFNPDDPRNKEKMNGVLLVVRETNVTTHDGDATRHGRLKVSPAGASEFIVWARNTSGLLVASPGSRRAKEGPKAIDFGKQLSRALFVVEGNRLVLFFDHGLGDGEMMVFERESH
jgi:hypothetical protein